MARRRAGREDSGPIVNSRPPVIPDVTQTRHAVLPAAWMRWAVRGSWRLSRFLPYYRHLLDHHNHMTVTLEAACGCPVAVEVKRRRLTREHYERKSVLRAARGGRVLQYCVVRLSCACLDETVREEIEGEQIPLGRILIHHNVLRQVQMFALWRITTGPELHRRPSDWTGPRSLTAARP